MSTLLHHTQPQVATQDHIHQTPDLCQRHMKHNLAIFHIDLMYVWTHIASSDPYAIPVFSTKFAPQIWPQLSEINLPHSWLCLYKLLFRGFSHGPVTFLSLCLRCCGGMDCNCVSDLLLPPVPALWTPGQSLFVHLLIFVEVWLTFEYIKITANVQKSKGKSKQNCSLKTLDTSYV